MGILKEALSGMTGIPLGDPADFKIPTLFDINQAIPKLDLGLFTIGASESVAFKGESSSYKRDRKAYDRKARKDSGTLTSSQMYNRGLHWKDGGILPEPFATNFKNDFGMSPSDYQKYFAGKDATTITQEDIARLQKAAVGVPKTIAAADRDPEIDSGTFKPSGWLIGILVAAVLGILAIPKLFNFKTKKRRR